MITRRSSGSGHQPGIGPVKGTLLEAWHSVLRQSVDAACNTGVSRLTCVGEAMDSNFKKALEEGLHWTVLDKRVDVLYPGFANLVQRALNALGQLHSSETIFELMLQVQHMASDSMHNGEKPDWKTIAAAVKQSEPPHPEDIPNICSFVQKFGGGQSGRYIEEINEFVKACVPAGRIITGQVPGLISSAFL